MEKENLILVHSFPTNSIVLSGLINYLNNFFVLYPIDLPGFIKTIPPLPDISIKNYCDYLDNKISDLGLPNYYIAGISFGFRIINDANLTKECKGIIAVEPYLNSESLKIKKPVKEIGASLAHNICQAGIEGKLWNQTLFRVPPLRGPNPKVGKLIFDQVDPETFFKTIEIIATDDSPLTFHNLPHSLVINKKDKRLRSDYIISQFEKNVNKLFVCYTEAPHFPKDLSVKYFETHFKSDDINKIINFFKEQQ